MTTAQDPVFERQFLGIVLGIAFALGLLSLAIYASTRVTEQAMVLLIPDEAANQEPVLQAWLDAAREEGVPLTVMTDNEFMRYGGAQLHTPGVIIPDMVHQRASDLLVSQLESYAQGGGKLWVNHDACVLDSASDAFAPLQSRLSTLVGVPYAFYQALGGETYAQGAVFGSRAFESKLAIQPGKLDFENPAQRLWGELSTYGYPQLHYTYFRTGKPAGGEPLMRSANNDVVASESRMGKGAVLFVNLPLGFLKTRTDGYLLHQFMRYFATGMARQPYLSPVPDAVGGVVMNLHIDSNASQASLNQMEAAGWFDIGPMSLHVTAGPDATTRGDQLGLDLANNAPFQGFLQRRVAQGQEIGDHGGWIHNLFGSKVSEENASEYQPYLELNHLITTAVTGRAARSYSSPMGNQPPWVTQWLNDKGYKAFYTAGNNGLGPTRAYVNGRRPNHSLWAFPVSNYYQIATFEELGKANHDVTGSEMGAFFEQIAEYAAQHRVARLLYFHAPSATQYPAAFEHWVRLSRTLLEQGNFRWYTMEQLADFQTRREKTQWHLERLASGDQKLVAHLKEGLEHLSWVISTRQRPLVVKGNATVRRAGQEWIVTAGPGTTLEIHWN